MKRQREGKRDRCFEADRGKSMEGVKTTCLAWLARGTGIPSILHIYSFSTIDTQGRHGRQGQKGSADRNARAQRTDITVLRSSTFQGRLFSSWRGSVSFQQR